MSSSLWLHGLQHSRLPCPSPPPRVGSNSCPWFGDAILPSHPLLPPSPLFLNKSLARGIALLNLSWIKHRLPLELRLIFLTSQLLDNRGMKWIRKSVCHCFWLSSSEPPSYVGHKNLDLFLQIINPSGKRILIPIIKSEKQILSLLRCFCS